MYKILYIHRYSTIHINCQVSDSVFVISSINPICFLCIYYKNNVQIIFVRWRGDSEIVEANAEHGFRLKKLIGMLCATNSKTSFAAQIFCAICQAALPGRPFDTRILYGKKLPAAGRGSDMLPLRRSAIKDAWQNQTSFFSSLILFPLHLFHNRNYLRYHIVHIFKHSAFCRSHLARPFDMFQYLPVSFFHLVEAKA